MFAPTSPPSERHKNPRLEVANALAGADRRGPGTPGGKRQHDGNDASIAAVVVVRRIRAMRQRDHHPWGGAFVDEACPRVRYTASSMPPTSRLAPSVGLGPSAAPSAPVDGPTGTDTTAPEEAWGQGRTGWGERPPLTERLGEAPMQAALQPPSGAVASPAARALPLSLVSYFDLEEHANTLARLQARHDLDFVGPLQRVRDYIEAELPRRTLTETQAGRLVDNVKRLTRARLTSALALAEETGSGHAAGVRFLVNEALTEAFAELTDEVLPTAKFIVEMHEPGFRQQVLESDYHRLSRDFRVRVAGILSESAPALLDRVLEPDNLPTRRFGDSPLFTHDPRAIDSWLRSHVRTSDGATIDESLAPLEQVSFLGPESRATEREAKLALLAATIVTATPGPGMLAGLATDAADVVTPGPVMVDALQAAGVISPDFEMRQSWSERVVAAASVASAPFWLGPLLKAGRGLRQMRALGDVRATELADAVRRVRRALTDRDAIGKTEDALRPFGGADAYSGPTRVQSAPHDAAELDRVFARLSAGEPLDTSEVETLLGAAATRTFERFASRSRPGDRLAGACGGATEWMARLLRDAGIPGAAIHLQQTHHYFIGGDRLNALLDAMNDADAGVVQKAYEEWIAIGERVDAHAFLTVDTPNGSSYLVDPTYLQFFDPRDVEARAGRVARAMRGDPAGSELADRLLSRGFVELTDDVATTYMGAFTSDSVRVRAADLRQHHYDAADLRRALEPG